MADHSTSLALGQFPPEEVKAQLARVLASSHFKNSRRCSTLLEYVVVAACDGRLDCLKERAVGSAVFGREADYDTNQDAVVRNAAAEVRKRLAQYYVETEGANELRIDLPSGSYLPAFRPHTVAERAPQPAAVASNWMRVALVVTLVGILAMVAAYAISARRPPPTELDRFWAPVVQSPGVVQMCIGQTSHYYSEAGPAARPTQNPAALQPMRDRFVYMGDGICMTRLSGYLYSKGKDCRYRGAMTTPYSELRGNPVVLIGMFNNQWTLRLTQDLRYQLVKDENKSTIQVRDTIGPVAIPFTLHVKDTAWDNEADYAVITRVFDRRTERWVVAGGGVTQYGTMAVGDFLSKPEYFREAVRSAPADWAKKNMQIVLETKVEGGAPGPPKVLASHFW